MKIEINGWKPGRGDLDDTGFSPGEVREGTVEEAFQIGKEIFETTRRNVMFWSKESEENRIVIFVSKGSFSPQG